MSAERPESRAGHRGSFTQAQRGKCGGPAEAVRARRAGGWPGGYGLRHYRPLRSCLSPTRAPVRASAPGCAPAHTQHTPAPVEPAHIEALQTAVARQDVDTLGGGCAPFVDRLAGVRTHALSPGGDGTAVAGTGGMPITRGSLGSGTGAYTVVPGARVPMSSSLAKPPSTICSGGRCT